MHSVTRATRVLLCVNVSEAIRALGVSLALLLISLPLFSQANQGTIQGGVFDQTGGAIAGATVTITDVARGVSRALTADSAGLYVAPNLIPGTYTVRGQAKGFQTVDRTDVILEVGQSVRVDVVLRPGEQTQAITVTGEVPAIDTTDVTLGGTIEQQAIAALPLVSRDFKNLMELRPGVTPIQGGGFSAWSANGLRAEDIGYLLDGLRADAPSEGNSLINSPSPAGDTETGFPMDAIQEINNQENPKAEAGWKPGAIINVGVKSGTNSLHGAAFAYGRDTSFDARNFFDTPPLPKQAVALEEFGGSAGGRIIKDKLFWFGAYEGQRLNVGNIVSASSPATVSLGGCTAASPAGCGNPGASLVDACLDLAHTGKAISPLSAQLAGLNPGTCAVAPTNYTPGPTESLFPPDTGAVPIIFPLPTVAWNDNGVGKIDYRVNDKHTINGMYHYGTGALTVPPSAGFAGVPTTSIPFSQTFSAQAELVSGAWNWAVSSTRINEFRLGYAHYHQEYTSVDANVNPLAYGINTGATDPKTFGIPSIGITGYGSFGGSQHKIVGPDNIIQLLDHFSLVHGAHAIKFGGEFIDDATMDSYQNSGGKGSFAFSNIEAFLQGNVKVNGNSILVGDPTRHLSNQQYALFVQDDWRATRKVIVNLGLRWEYNSVLKERGDLIGNFDPTLGLVQVGKQINSPWKGDFRDFSPRLGFAWDMFGNGKTVLRAGGSLMYSYPALNTFIASNQRLGLTLVPTGATIVTQGACAAGCAGLGSIAVVRAPVPGGTLTTNWQSQTAACVSGGTTACGSIFPTNTLKLQCGDGISGDPNPCTTLAIDPNYRTPQVETWTLGIQRAITNNLSLDVDYIGTHGGRINGLTDINRPALGSGFTAQQIALGDPSVNDLSAENVSRPLFSKFPYLSDINQLANLDVSNYNALQVTLNQRAWHSFSFLAGYTYSHALDDVSTNIFPSLPADGLNPATSYGSSDFDARNRFTLTASYTLPGRKSPGQMLQGWQINAVLTLSSGQPWSPHDLSNDLSGTGQVNDVGTFGESWNFSGSRADFTSGSSVIPCWSGSGVAALALCSIGGATAPAACTAGAAAISANTVAALNSIGCYVSANGKSVLFPAALGTFGDAGRNIFRDSGFKNLDLSVFKDWKFRERYDAQFRAEFFNIFNHPNFANPGGLGSGAGYNDPSGSQSSNFGCGCITPDQAAPNPVLGSGGSRSIQLGLRLSF